MDEGEDLRALIGARDWSRTPLGALPSWPAELRTLVAVMLGSQQPMFLTWGPERTLLYNDGYAEILARKHPEALGRPLLKVWPEIRSDLQPLLDQVDTGKSVHMDDITLIMERNGFPEETHFAFSYTPVRDEAGRIVGMFCPCQETTGQVLAERRNVAERQRLEQLFEQAPGFMAMMRGPDHVFELANLAYLQLVGHRDLVGRTVREAFPEIEGQGFFELLDKVYATGEAFKGSALEVELQRERGALIERRFIDLVYQPVTDSEGRVTGIFAEGSDVTERVRAEAAYREREARLRLVMDGAKDHAIFTTDPSGEIISWSAGAAAIFGWGEAEAIGQPTSLVFVPEDRAAGVPAAELDTAERDGFANDERWHLRKDGSRVFMNGSVHPLPPDGLGRRQGFIKIARDETERRAAQVALGESEARFRNMADDAPVMMWVTDPTGFCTYLNRRWYEFTGQTEAEALGFGWTNATHPDHQKPAEDAFLAANAAQAPFRVEYRLRRVDGAFRWAIDAATPRFGSGGEFLGYVGSVIDIDERREAEERLRESETRARELAAQQAATLSQLVEGVIVTDAEGRVALVNEASARIHGVARLDVAPDEYSSSYSLLTEDGEPYPSLDLPLARAVRGETVLDARWRIRRPNGDEVVAVGNARPVRDAAGRQIGAVLTLRDDTARVTAEAALRESEAHYRNAAELNPQVAWTATPDGQLDRVAERWRDWTGTTGLGDSWGQGLHPDDLARSGETWLRSVRTGIPYDIEHRVKMVSGEFRWARSRAFPRQDSEGRIVKWYGSTEDIHEQKLAEELLRGSEARFRTVAEAIPGFIWTADRAGNLDYTSPRWHHYSGSGPDESLGGGWAAAVHPDDQALALQRWTQAVATRTPYEAEFRLRRADGVFRWWLARALPSLEGRSGNLRWVGVCTELEEIIAARETLTRSREALEELVTERTRERDRVWQKSRDLLVIIGSDGVFRAVNPAWTTILGHQPVEVVGRSFLDFVWPDDAAPTPAGLEPAAPRADLTDFENRYRHRDGTPRWISWRTSVEGDLVYAYGRDITAEKEQAEALRQAEEQLRQAQKMEAVGQLTGGIAHDFNNLLAGIVGSLDLMQTRLSQGRTDSIERYAKAAMSSAQRAAALTHRLLAFSRRQPLDPKPVNANQLIASMEDLLRRTIGPLHALELVTAGGLWTTLCDPNQLESAILNLAINARDAMPDGGKLTIETANSHLDDAYVASQRDVTPGQYVAICITDTGTGMPPEVVARAFEPFFTTKPLGQGTGLGLSMVYGFTKQSEGHLKIYSEVGQGTTMRIYLPRHRGGAEEEEIETLGTGAQALRAEAGETVLVVEDEPVIRHLIVEVLHDLGYRALEAADGPAGLRVLQSRERIDLLVTDVGLPGLNGRQLADHAREKRPGLKVLFITGYAENAATANGFLDHGMEMITKPFAIEALGSKIRSMIRDGANGS